MNQQALDCDKPKVGRNCKEFLNLWIQSIKNKPLFSEYELTQMMSLLKLVIKRVQFPSWYKFSESCEKEEGEQLEFEEDYDLYRKELIVIFQNLAMIAPFQSVVLATITDLFKSFENGTKQVTVHSVEGALFVADHLQAAIPGNLRDSKETLFYTTIFGIMKIDFMGKFFHSAIALQYIELLLRYSTYYINDPSFVQIILEKLFFS